MVKLRNIDLNLLVMLDALLDEAHVGRAADRLGLSQPAASNALGRARHLFDDQLLVRGPLNSLRRTSRAEAIRHPLHAALAELAAVLDTAPPNLADLRGTVRIVGSDVPTNALGPILVAQLAKLAPGINLIFHPWHVGGEVVRLERGEVDLVLAAAACFGGALRTRLIGRYPYSVLMRHDHPAFSDMPLDIDRWLALPHVIISGSGDQRGSIDGALSSIGRERRAAVVVPTFLQALELLRYSDLIGTFPSSAPVHGLVSCPPPLPLDPIELHLVRHRRTDEDLAVTTVADLIADMAMGADKQV